MSEWIKWEGGKCPVPEGTLIDVRYRDMTEALCLIFASTNYWLNENMSNDIIAYRLCEPVEHGPIENNVPSKQNDLLWGSW